MQATGILRETCSILSCLEELSVDAWRFRAFDHALASLDAARSAAIDPVGCVVALLSGVGRRSTRGAGFAHHERVAADLVGRWFRDYRFSNEERKRAMHLLGHQDTGVDDLWNASQVRRWLKRVTPASAEAVLNLREAILTGAATSGASHLDGRPVADEQRKLHGFRGLVKQVLETDPPLGVGDLAIGGQDILSDLGVSPGRRVGELLEEALEAVLENPDLNERAALLRFLRRRMG